MNKSISQKLDTPDTFIRSLDSEISIVDTKYLYL